jgi:hypothetical protein
VKSSPALTSWAFVSLLLFAAAAAGQKVAIVAPEDTRDNVEMAAEFSELLKAPFNVQDFSMSFTAWRSANLQSPFNLTNVEARQIGELLGTQAFLLVKSQTLRRSDSQRPEYYESFVSVYVVNSRSGSLAMQPGDVEIDQFGSDDSGPREGRTSKTRAAV